MVRVRVAAVVSMCLVLVAGCARSADVVSENLSKEADEFRINRRIVFYNGITGEYMSVIEGLCSLGNSDSPGQLTVTCQVGPGEYKKHFLGLSDNVTYMVEQVDGHPADKYRYSVVFKPSVVVPSVELSVP